MNHKNSTPQARTGMLRALLCMAVVSCTVLPAAAQDAARTIGGLLQGLASQVTSNSTAAPAAASNSAGGDLLKLLSESIDQIDEPREIEIGRQLAAVLLGSKPLHKDMALQRYVNRLGRWISLSSSRPHLPWTFAVLDDTGFNAFAAPGGYVFVTKGLIDRVDEAELAGILAHEIMHVTHKHHLQALRAKARAGIATQLIASQLSNTRAAHYSGPMLSLGRDLYSSGLDKDDEFDADRAGVLLAARAGFDPYGLPSVLQQLRTATPDNPLFALTLNTHPPAQQRLEKLEVAMGSKLDTLAGKPSVSVSQRLRSR